MNGTDRRTVRAGVVGGALAFAVFLAMIFGGHASLLQTPPSASDFFDVQAHSLLAGRWDVPRSSLNIEGFVVHGKVYEYFGPLPALFRIPIAALTHRFDGRLGQLSLLIAFVLALTFTFRIFARIRPLVRGADPVTRAERWATGLFVFVAGAGSVFTFLASRAWAYHEAELWGAALALGAFEFVFAYTVEATRRHLVLASVFTTAALLTRGSVGAGPLVALGLVLVAGWWQRTRRIAGLSERGASTPGTIAMLVALAIPVALYAYVNHAKFGTFFSLPFNAQVSNKVFEGNRYVLFANHGSMFNPHLIPTDALQYLVPDVPKLISLFPWVSFPPAAGVVGIHTVLYTWTASFPTVMPFLAVLAVTGIVGLVRRSRPGRPTLAALRAPVIGAAAATIPTLSYAYLAQRYLSDFMPLAILLAATGLHLLLRWSHGRAGAQRARHMVVWGLLGVLAALSVWWNVGLGIIYGRLLDGSVRQGDLASFVAFQYDLHDRFPGGTPPAVQQGDALPHPAVGRVFVLGKCAGLYWSDGTKWVLLEGTPTTGTFRLRVTFAGHATEWEPLVTSFPRGGKPQYMAVRTRADGRVQFAYDGVFRGPAVRVGLGAHTVEVVMDPEPRRRRDDNVQVTVDGHHGYDNLVPNPIISERLRPLREVTFGGSDATPGRFSGTVAPLPARTPLCDRLRPHS